MEKEIELARKLLRYDPKTGKLFWEWRTEEDFPNVRPRILMSWNKRWVGKEAFTSIGTHGYFCGAFLGKQVLAHRVCWILYHGYSPNCLIDHINGNRLDNRIKNLRVVDFKTSSRNLSRRTDNTSGATGVYKSKNGKWFCRIVHEGRKVHLGTFETFEEAVIKRKEAEVKYGYHENHGRTL